MTNPEFLISYSTLPNTSLCSIVRDEKMNPAGGIERFVHSHLPFVEEAIIADTGSIDGTREILEEMENIYSHLKVIDLPFEGYSKTRNKALSYIKTKYTLILDADELITHETPNNDWLKIKNFMNSKKKNAYRLLFDVVSTISIKKQTISGNTLRLFETDLFKDNFKRILWEYLSLPQDVNIDYIKDVSIKHFIPIKEGVSLKDRFLYQMDVNGKPLQDQEVILNNWKTISPSMREGFVSWKKYNPKRDDYN